jgi:hypothetical protein
MPECAVPFLSAADCCPHLCIACPHSCSPGLIFLRRQLRGAATCLGCSSACSWTPWACLLLPLGKQVS